LLSLRWKLWLLLLCDGSDLLSSSIDAAIVPTKDLRGIDCLGLNSSDSFSG